MELDSPDSGSDDASLHESEDSDVNSDISTFLRLLLRSGRIHFLPNGADDEDDEDEVEQDDCGELNCTGESSDATFSRSTSQGCSSSSSTPEENGIEDQVMMDSGQFGSPFVPRLHGNIAPKMTHMREAGFFSRQGNLPRQQMAALNHHFLPNHYEIMQKFHRKAFCGTYSKEGNIFLSACQDERIRIYDTSDNSDWRLIKNIQARDVGWSVLDTAFSPDGLFLIYSSWSDCIHICSVYGENDIHEPLHLCPEHIHSFCIFSLMFSMDNTEIIGGANQGFLYIYDRIRGERTLRVRAHDDDTNAVCFADSSSHILYSGSDDGLVKVWDRRTLQECDPKPVGVFAGHRDGITYIDTKGDGRYLISNCKDQTIKLWDVRKFSSDEGLRATQRAVAQQDWDYRWQVKPSRNHDKGRLKGDSSVMTYKGHQVLNTLMRARFSPLHSTGQRYIYTGTAQGGVIIFDVLTGRLLKNFDQVHTACVRDISWHPYLTEIATTSWDGKVSRLWYKASDKRDRDEDEMEDSCKTKRSKPSLRMRLRSQPL